MMNLISRSGIRQVTLTGLTIGLWAAKTLTNELQVMVTAMKQPAPQPEKPSPDGATMVEPDWFCPECVSYELPDAWGKCPECQSPLAFTTNPLQAIHGSQGAQSHAQ